jgi:glucose/arabinose dehydrogenase
MSARLRSLVGAMVAIMVAVVAAAAVLATKTPAAAAVLPSGFQEQIVFSGLSSPTAVEFAPDGRIFVAEQAGLIKVFDNLADTTPTVFADLRTNVLRFIDRGLLGLALAPGFPANPWVYVAYSYDAPPGAEAPFYKDVCADLNNQGRCVITSRLSRLRASGNAMTGTEEVLVSDWCQQYGTHAIGDLKFGPDGALYVTAGDGAAPFAADYGQLGNPANPCADPANEGGALRTQDIRTSGDPLSFDGTLLRLNPETGAAMPGNPNASSPDVKARSVVAYGLRNPFRTTIRPGTGEVWIADVGWSAWEEINRYTQSSTAMTNFGWPCYEGSAPQVGYDAANLPMCESLYTGPAPTMPYFAWRHPNKIVPTETCPVGGSAATGLAFYPNAGPYPAAYRGALFFADFTRDCIWVMKPTATSNGLPDRANIETFVAEAANPVDVKIGPGGEVYYVDHSGTIRRLRYFAGNQPPVAKITSSTTSGNLPLSVTFGATTSTDADQADQGRLTYAWDFTGDGTTDSTAAAPTFVYRTAGTYTARLTVTDTLGATGTATVTILAGVGAPTAVIDTPVAGTTWATNDTVSYSGHATDPQDGDLPGTRLTWKLRLEHCSPDGTLCHTHVMEERTGASGTFTAPDHEYPSYMELELTATDSSNHSQTVVRRINPKTVAMTFATSTPGLPITVGDRTMVTPFTVTMIQKSTATVSAEPVRIADQVVHDYVGWSDGGAATHVITAPTAPTVLTARYTATTLINLALGAETTASSRCNDNEGSPKAVNGSVSGGNSDKWCGAGTDTNKWLRVDLGSRRELRAIVVRHAGTGGETPAYNTRDFVVETSVDGTNWTTAATVTNNTADVTTHPVDVTARYARVRISAPTSNASTAARIYELEVLGTTGTPPTPPPPDLTNLARDAEATASSVCNANEGPEKAVNGSVNGGNSDKWCGAGPDTDKWLKVDLGARQDISNIVVHHAGAAGEPPAYNTRGFVLETSADGTNWSNAATVGNNTADVTSHPVSVSARYVRLRITVPTSSPSTAARIYELEVLGVAGSPPPPPPPPPTNLALAGTATASSVCNENEGPEKAINGTVNGGNSDKWCGAGPDTDKWLKVDLGASRAITSVVVHHAGAGGEIPAYNTAGFTVETSADGTTWTTVATVSGNTANVTTHPLTGVSARYVRVRILTPTSNASTAARIYEIEVFGPTP